MPQGVGARFFETVDSTNQLATQAALDGLQGPCWFIAGTQAAGRGRRGRVWTSEPGNLYASLMFRPALAPADLTALPFICALAVRDTFVELGAAPDQVACKWPNDVLIGGRKASGILIESSARQSTMLDFIVIGIGMNLAQFPADAQFPATSLKAATGHTCTVRDAVAILSGVLYTRITDWQPHDFSPIRKEWTNAAWGLGHSVRLRTSDSDFTGTPVALEADGALFVRLDDGTEKRLYAGDIFPVSMTD